MITHYVEQASTFAGDIDFIFELIFWVVIPWGLAAEVMFFWLLWKFRHKEGQKAQYLDGSEHHVKKWIEWPHYLVILCDIVLIVGAIRVWNKVKIDTPAPESTIRVIGQQWSWAFVHPGPDNQLDTPDDIKTVDELHVEVGKVYNVQLQSRDVLHSFSVPVFRLKQDAIPGRTIIAWFEATKAGVHDIQCTEICGIGHGIMGARIYLETPEDHAKWVQNPVTRFASATP